LLEAINAPITKMTPASPPEPCCLDLHRGGCSLFCQSANEPWQHGIRHTTLPNYNIMLIWPHPPSVFRHSTNTRPGTSSHLRPPHKAKTKARQLAPLPLNWWRFLWHILSLHFTRMLLYLQIELICYYLQKYINTS
jgi:hypothetical protein